MYRPADLVFAVVMLSLLAQLALTSLLAHHGGAHELFSNPYMPTLVPLWWKKSDAGGPGDRSQEVCISKQRTRQLPAYRAVPAAFDGFYSPARWLLVAGNTLTEW